jgi:hypothetical protein
VFHACRHSCASTLLAEGAPLTAVAGHMGDTVETVSRTHVHWLRDDRDIPAQVLDRMLSRLVWSRPHCPARWSEVRFSCHGRRSCHLPSRCQRRRWVGGTSSLACVATETGAEPAIGDRREYQRSQPLQSDER